MRPPRGSAVRNWTPHPFPAVAIVSRFLGASCAPGGSSPGQGTSALFVGQHRRKSQPTERSGRDRGEGDDQ